MAIKNNDDLWNSNIPYESLIIGNDGTNYGLMKRFDALRKAKELGFDILCISPNARPPVCKMFKFDKYRFEQQQKEKEAKKAQKAAISEEKEIRLSAVIGDHDIQTKAKNARKFLNDGNKVKITLKYRGRQNSNPEIGKEVIMKFYKELEDICIYDKSFDKKEKNIQTIYLFPKKKSQEN
ncbi:translation initiation factor IF-3 [Spiroplasma endosymbiont of Virgichneumon dumeticola]|uniref:translation initiation factor IF-3 n=1 Tax=Spiroplasma endosymbiont of Virgichneumon dumeticola TaxID=3139323 RepID=UPI0035C8D768